MQNLHELNRMYDALKRDLEILNTFSYTEWLELGAMYEKLGMRDKSKEIYKMAVREHGKRKDK